MIELSDDLRQAFRLAPAAERGCYCAVCLDHRLVALLTHIEQNRDERYAKLLAANRKLVDRLRALEHIEDERDRALGELEDARRQMARNR